MTYIFIVSPLFKYVRHHWIIQLVPSTLYTFFFRAFDWALMTFAALRFLFNEGEARQIFLFLFFFFVVDARDKRNKKQSAFLVLQSQK